MSEQWAVETARAEIITRLVQRDLAIPFYSSAAASVFAYSIDKNKPELLLLLPPLALIAALFAAYHDSLLRYLHEYVAQHGGERCWDNSPQRQQYSKSRWRYAYLGVQLLSFVGTSAAALAIVYHRLGVSLYFAIDLLLMLMCLGLVLSIRLWRVRECAIRPKQPAKTPAHAKAGALRR